MSKQGWSTSTYEVLTAKGDRWLIDMSSSKQSEAQKRADDLLSMGGLEGVRITELREGWSKEKTIYEKILSVKDNQFKIDPIPNLEMCLTIPDYYALPSRLTIGRMMRKYLDQNGLTALELLFSSAHLRALDRMDAYFPAAMQHAAMLQAKKTKETKTERLDKLYLVYDKIFKRARRKDDEYKEYAELMAKYGADRAISEVKAKNPKTPDIAVFGMLAAHIQGGTWSEKMSLAIDIAEQATSPSTISAADDLIAEILDGVEAIDELFRGFSTAKDAWKVYVRLCGGRLNNPPKYMSAQIQRLNDLFLHQNICSTRNVLLKRVSRGLGGTQKLSKDGRDADRSAFISLVRELIEPSGLHGGPDMVEAVVLRAKTLLGETEGDLPIETAIRQALYLMPSQASRLGMLLDLATSNLGQKHEKLVRQQLLSLLDELRSIFDLFPADVKKEEHIQALDRLRQRLGMSPLAKDLKSTLSKSLDKLAEGETIAPKKEKPKITRKESASGQSDELMLQSGEVLFHEGEAGHEAYLIVQGSVEIYRHLGGKKKALAVLGSGEIIGEMALVDNQPRMASASAAEDTVMVCISQDNLQGRLTRLAKDDTVMHLLIKTLVRRLRGLARNTE